MGIKKVLLPFIAASTIIAGGTVHQVTQRQYDFTSQWEGVEYVPYPDVAVPSILTVCRGITSALAPGWVIAGKTYSKEECFNKEIELLDKVAKDIAPLIKVSTSQEQREMLGDFVWNAGIGALKTSTMLKLINQDKCVLAAQQFDRWVYSGGRKWKGLASRRNAEEDRFDNWCLPDGTFPKIGTNNVWWN